MNATLATEIKHLTPAEKLQLVEDLWADLAANVERLPIPAWHEKALAEDQTLYNSKLAEGSGWAEVRARITGQP